MNWGIVWHDDFPSGVFIIIFVFVFFFARAKIKEFAERVKLNKVK